MERVSGVEPPSLPWQGSIIAVIRHPLSSAKADFGGQARARDFMLQSSQTAKAVFCDFRMNPAFPKKHEIFVDPIKIPKNAWHFLERGASIWKLKWAEVSAHEN